MAAAAFACTILFSTPLWAAHFTHPTGGYSFTYPGTWTVDPTRSGGVSLKNFRQYLDGGLVPPGGAEITIGRFPPDTHEATELSTLAEQDEGTNVSTSGGPPLKIDYLSPDKRERHTCLAARVEGRVFIACLTYNSNDPRGAPHQQALTTLVNSLSVAPPARTPVPSGTDPTPPPAS